MHKSMLVGAVSVCLLLSQVYAEDISLESNAFTLLTEKRLRTGKDVYITGLVGATDRIKLGNGTFVDSDVLTAGKFNASAHASIKGRLVANDNINLSSYVQVGALDGSSDARVGKGSLIFGDVAVGGKLKVHPEAVILGGSSSHNDSWAASSIPDPIATSFLPANLLVDITIGSGKISMLQPGNYARLKLKNNSTLILSAGTYFFDEIMMRRKGTIVTDTSNGPVNVYVDNLMKTAAQGTIQKTGTKQGTFTVFGQTKIGSSNSLFTNIITLDQLKVGANSHLIGSFYSEDNLTLGNRVVVSAPSTQIVPEPAAILFLAMGIVRCRNRKFNHPG